MHIDPLVDANAHLAREAAGSANAESKREWAIAMQAEIWEIDAMMERLLRHVEDVCHALENAPSCESADDDTAQTCREDAYAAMGAIHDRLTEVERFAEVAMRELEVYDQ